MACRQVKLKKELTRLVATIDGIVIDKTGKLPGRGAYLCNNTGCWDEGIKGNKLERALQITLSSDDRNTLRHFALMLVTEEGKL